MVKASIIVPCKEIDDYTRRCILYCKTYCPDEELIVIPDSVCPGLPAVKRNFGMSFASGDVFAFLDSDAYPSKEWLKEALYHLQFYSAVCGPGVLPPDAPFEELVADQVHKWMFCPYRVTPQAPRIVKWFPTFNLIVKREVATQFENYLTGEDDKFGLNIPSGIYYHPDILVYHNRRGIFKPLWRQFGQWGTTKGHFIRLSLIAYVTTLYIYCFNWIKGFLKRKI